MSAGDVVVTGLGVVSGLGPDLQSFRDGIFSGRSGIGPLSLFSCPDARSQLVAQAAEPELPGTPLLHHTSRADRSGCGGAVGAGSRGAYTVGPARCGGAVLGTGTGGAADTERYLRQRQQGQTPKCNAAHSARAGECHRSGGAALGGVWASDDGDDGV